jgi:tRNA wybutosine-synthesizing protein 3
MVCRLLTLEKLRENKNHLSTTTLKISGEPIEKLFLWGQASCVFTIGEEQQVLTFGGFGGPGRHARRNYSLLLDHKSGLLTEMIFKASPSPRMGHTVTAVDNTTYIIGGRGGPSEILDDVWILPSVGNTWSKLECCGDLFRPRYSLDEIMYPLPVLDFLWTFYLVMQAPTCSCCSSFKNLCIWRTQ